MLTTLIWPTLAEHRLPTRIIMFYKIVHQLVTISYHQAQSLYQLTQEPGKLASKLLDTYSLQKTYTDIPSLHIYTVHTMEQSTRILHTSSNS